MNTNEHRVMLANLTAVLLAGRVGSVPKLVGDKLEVTDEVSSPSDAEIEVAIDTAHRIWHKVYYSH